MVSKQERQAARGENQDAERNQLLFCWRIVIPALGYITLAVGSGFSPPKSIRPN